MRLIYGIVRKKSSSLPQDSLNALKRQKNAK